MKKLYLLIALLGVAVICGCGKTDKLDAYYTGMQSFCSNTQIITEEIDMVNLENESAASQISDLLDRLEAQFKTMSELDVPSNFASCEELGDDAYNYMVEANSLYKSWLANKDNEDNLRMAKENYDRALTRVNYISIVLQGGIPQGDNISTYEEDSTDFAPVTDDSSADEVYEDDTEEYYEDEFYDDSVDEFAEPDSE